MPELFEKLASEPRLLMEADLRPLQTSRFQPTGFPDLGAARYQLHDGTEMLLVESAQSVANRLEAACWDDAEGDLVESLQGLPYVKINLGELGETTTVHEFHRLNSPYIWEADEKAVNEATNKFKKDLREAIGLKEGASKKKKAKEGEESGEVGADVPGVLNYRRLARSVFKYDPNSLVHGVFLEKLAGRLRLTRALSGFIEAEKVRAAESGGTKMDHVLPKPKQLGLDAKTGFGHVPFHRTEFTAGKITASFNLDLALLRGYGLGKDATDLLIALALFKVQRFLEQGLRLRTACDLETVNGGLRVTRPDGFAIPSLAALEACLKEKIAACASVGLFASPSVTEIEWKPKPKKDSNSKKDEPDQAEETNEEEESES